MMQDDHQSEGQITDQDNLFGLDVVSMRPVLGKRTAHLRHTVIATDGWEYAVKCCQDGADSLAKIAHNPMLVPASEWLCTKLADMCGIATPHCKIIHDESTGVDYFGSRYDLSATSTPMDEITFAEHLCTSTALKNQVWAIYAFDQFVFNIDRNLSNYLYSVGRDGHVIVQPFDFGFSSLVMGWPNRTGDALLPYGCPTTDKWVSIRKLTGDHPSCRESGIAILDKLSRIQPGTIESICNAMPESWLNPLQKSALTSWWASNNRQARIDVVRKEVLR
ncbi:hypothetical protein [Cronobacter sakazakii]|uniref:hypothetical protein n=2 Tax=Cronobacter sakazakii TaxID=28141 RepID=UPI001EFE7BA6|nr:hypothetical protein [Cronobacter sakazakii]